MIKFLKICIHHDTHVILSDMTLVHVSKSDDLIREEDAG
jgi:hypothetical protein